MRSVLRLDRSINPNCGQNNRQETTHSFSCLILKPILEDYQSTYEEQSLGKMMDRPWVLKRQPKSSQIHLLGPVADLQQEAVEKCKQAHRSSRLISESISKESQLTYKPGMFWTKIRCLTKAGYQILSLGFVGNFEQQSDDLQKLTHRSS